MTNTDVQRQDAASHRPEPQPAARTSQALTRGLALVLGLSLSLGLAACGGGNNNNCGSAGNTRVLHCAP